jgi:hypothetical protein
MEDPLYKACSDFLDHALYPVGPGMIGTSIEGFPAMVKSLVKYIDNELSDPQSPMTVDRSFMDYYIAHNIVNDPVKLRKGLTEEEMHTIMPDLNK